MFELLEALSTARAWADSPVTLLTAAIALVRLRGTWQGVAIGGGLALVGAVLAAHDWRLPVIYEHGTSVWLVVSVGYAAVLAGALGIRAVLEPGS